MTHEEIIADNRLIAEFMGLAPVPMSNKFGWSDMPHFSCIHDTEEEVVQSIAEYAKYRTSWDWLMPVVEKIETLEDGRYDVNILTSGTQILAWRGDDPAGFIVDNVAEIDFYHKIEHCYAAVVEFIKWYNQNKLA